MSKSLKRQQKKKSVRSQKKLKTLISNNVEILRRLSNQ